MESPAITIDIEKRMHTAHGELNLRICTEVGNGELLALFGPSGAGKTTLLRILAGLAMPDRGTIRFGETVWFDSERRINLAPQLRNISYMFQDYALFPNMTVQENIQFAQPVRNTRDALELLEVFGLSEFARRHPDGLSGGQKQRVALARALARRPQLLLLDEPLSALDAGMRASLQDEIARAHQLLGATSILVSHDLGEVFRLASRVLCIEQGNIVRSGTPDEVFSDTNVSGKVQITGQIVRIDVQDTVNIITVVSGGNQIIKVIAFDSDMADLRLGDTVLVFTKAFNPIISRIG